MNNIRRIFTFNHVVSALLILVAAASLLVTGYAGYISGTVADQTTTEITSASDAASNLLDTSLLALQATANGLAESQDTLKTIDQTFLALDQAVVNSFDLMIETGSLTGETLPEVITATQSSLATAQETARSIEAFLKVVSKIPFFPGGPYAPAVSLDQALGDVAADLELLRPSMETMTTSLDSTHASMRQVQADILDIIIQLRQTQTSLAEAEAVVALYQAQVETIHKDLAAFNAAIPGRILAGVWFVRFILLWLAIGQSALLLYAIRLIMR